MKILFTRFPLESTLGGAEVQTMSLMKGLLAKGHAVAFLGSCPTLLKLCKEEGIPAAELHIGPPPVTKWGAVSFFWRKQLMQKKLETALENFSGLDAMFMLSLSEKLLLTEEATKNNIATFWVEHDRVGNWLKKNPWLPQLKKLSEKVKTVTVSELSRKLYVEIGWLSEQTIAIPNGIDLSRFAGPPSPTLPPRGKGDEEILLKKDRYAKNPVLSTVRWHARQMRKDPTKAEDFLWQYLRHDALGVRFRRQHPVGSKILDFYTHEGKLGIEVDGNIHDTKDQKILDSIKEEILEVHGIHLLRFSNEEVIQNPEKVISTIKKHLETTLPSPRGGRAGDGGLVELHLGTVARLTEDKGVDILLEAIRTLPTVSLTIVGQGKEEGYLRNMIASITDQEGITPPRIQLIPKVPDLGSFYKSLDAFILPSREHDPFGLVAAEAMSLGIATIVTKECGIASYVTDGKDALVVEGDSAADLQKAIESLMDDTKREKLAGAGKVTAQEKFSIDAMVQKYEDLLLSKSKN